MNPKANLNLFAQEINKHSYAICKSDLLVKGQDVSNVRLGDTLAEAKFADRGFDFILSNPPFGQDWKASETQVRREHEAANARFTLGLPAIGDGVMMFLLHVASKMRDIDEHGRGGRAGIVLNGFPLFNGGAGSGTSDILWHLLENDLIDTIVALPTDMFYNTGLRPTGQHQAARTQGQGPAHRRHRVRHRDAQVAGHKRVEIRDGRWQGAQRLHDDGRVGHLQGLRCPRLRLLVRHCRTPLRLNFTATPERIEAVAKHKQLSKIDGLVDSIGAFGTKLYRNRDGFLRDLVKHNESRIWHVRPMPHHVERIEDAFANVAAGVQVKLGALACAALIAVAGCSSAAATEFGDIVTPAQSGPVPDYDREAFGDGWADQGPRLQDTRQEVLIRDLVDEQLDAEGCKVLSGTLHDSYTGRTIAFQRGQTTSDDVQIDHRIPLAYA